MAEIEEKRQILAKKCDELAEKAADWSSMCLKLLAGYAYYSFLALAWSDAGETARTFSCDADAKNCLDLESTTIFTIVICWLYIAYTLIIGFYEYFHNVYGTGALLDILIKIFDVLNEHKEKNDAALEAQGFQHIGCHTEAAGMGSGA